MKTRTTKREPRLLVMTPVFQSTWSAVHELNVANASHYLSAKHWKSLVRLAQDMLMQQRHCVVCGCSDFRACPNGCGWVMTHLATPTGVCSNCWEKFIALCDKVSIKHGLKFQSIGSTRKRK